MRFSISLVLVVLVFPIHGQAPPTIDGYTYKTIKIGDQEWFAENLRTTVYANGDEIPYSRTDRSWKNQKMGMRCSFDHDEARSAEYGQLYSWFAVDDARGLCPSGWHVPTDEEWTNLKDYITSQGFAGTEGTALKSTTGWIGGGNGTDDFGFSALPGGGRSNLDGHYRNAGELGSWWSSSPSGGDAWGRFLSYSEPIVIRYYLNPPNGFSVRCLKDTE